jgi:hypothetical protein
MAGSHTLVIRLLIRLIVCSLDLRDLAVHALFDIKTRIMGSAVCLRLLRPLLRGSVPCLGRNILAIGVAVRGYGRDGNCREYGGYGGDIFFIVIRREFHAADPPEILEMANGGFNIENPIAAGHALRIRPRSDNGEKPVRRSP